MGVKITELLPEPCQIPLGNGKSMPVRGLTLSEVTVLLRTFRTQVLRLFVRGSDGQPDFAGLINTAPALVNSIIASATDNAEDEEQQEAIGKLVAGVQLIAITEIWRMTVSDQKKIQDALLGAMEEFKKTLRSLNAKSAPTSDTSPPKSEPLLN